MNEYKKVVLISLDTFRSDCIGANPDKLFPKEYKLNRSLEPTVLDDLCKDAAFFTNVISVAPYTPASHAAYFTGLWPKNNGIYDQFNSKLQTDSIFKYAKESGYTTIFKTDFPFILGSYLNLIGGVDHYFIEDDPGAMEALESHDKSLSFFHFGQIHYPYGFHNLTYGGKDYKEKVLFLEDKYNIRTEDMNLADMAIETFRDDKDLELLYRYKKIIAFLYSNKLDNDLFDLYLEGINYFFKTKFNKFLELLLEKLNGQNYLIVIFSDHGEAWNNQTYGHHNSLDEGVLRVPIVFYSENVKPKLYKERIRTIDLAPTIEELTFNTKKKYDGTSFADNILRGARISDREAFAAVWINESKDVLKKINRIRDNKSIDFDGSISRKYSACYYQDDYKYIEQYKTFENRSANLVDTKEEHLLKIESLVKQTETSDDERSSELRELLTDLNDIKTQKNIPTETLRDYFKLQGYTI